MAEQILVRLDIDGLEESIQGIGQLEREMKILNKQKKELEKRTEGLTNATEQETQEYALLSEKIKILRKDKTGLSRDVQKLTQAEKANLNTIEGLTKRNAALTAEMRKLDLTSKSGQARMKELRGEFLQNDAKVRQFNESLGRHQHNVGNYEGAIKSAGMALTAMVAGVTIAINTFNQINQMMSESIRLFGEQEKAERQLEFATGGAAEALKEQAKQIQANSTVGDEAVISQQAYLASLGFTEAQIMDMIQASVDLSAATGMSLDGAVRNLAKTYSGLTGELGESLPMLRDLTQEELKAGKATEVIREQFAGTAAEISKTGIGALERMENAYGDLQERLGEKLLPVQLRLKQVQMEVFESLMNFTETGAARSVIDFFQKLWSRLGQLGSIFTPMADLVKSFVFEIKAFAESLGFATSNANLAEGVMNVLKTAIKTALTPLIALTKGFIEFIKGVRTAVEQSEFLSTVFEKLGWILKETIGAAISSVGAAFDGLTTKFDQTLDGLSNLIAGAADMARAVGMGGLATQLDNASNSLSNYAENIRLAQQAEEDMANFRATRERKREMEADRQQQDHERELRAIDERRAAMESAATANSSSTEKEREAIEALSLEIQNFSNETEGLFSPEGLKVPEVNTSLDAMIGKAQRAGQVLQGVSQGFALIGDAINTRFQNQIVGIERATTAEKQGIEQSTMSEEQKRIAIERAEQKKATAIEKINEKQAKAQKAQAIIQSLINTALGVTKAIATTPFPLNLAMPIIIGGIGAVQTGIIAGTKFEEGGIAEGASHAEGGIPFTIAGQGGYEMEGGEAIINKKSTERFAPILSKINSYNGWGQKFEMGGVVPDFSNTQRSTAGRIESSAQQVASTVQNLRVINVATETEGMAARVRNIEGEATLG